MTASVNSAGHLSLYLRLISSPSASTDLLPVTPIIDQSIAASTEVIWCVVQLWD